MYEKSERVIRNLAAPSGAPARSAICDPPDPWLQTLGLHRVKGNGRPGGSGSLLSEQLSCRNCFECKLYVPQSQRMRTLAIQVTKSAFMRIGCGDHHASGPRHHIG